MKMLSSQAFALPILIKSSFLQFHLSQKQNINIHNETGAFFILNDYRAILNYIIDTIILSLTECFSIVKLLIHFENSEYIKLMTTTTKYGQQ